MLVNECIAEQTLMKLRPAGFVLLVFGILATAAGTSSANQIVNGGFESPAVAPANFLDINPGQEAGFGFTGWSVTTGNVDVVNATLPLFGINWGAQASIDGSQILDLNGFTEGGISQTFATILGQQYAVQVWYANNPLGPGGTAQLDVADVGTTNNSLLSTSLAHNTSTLTTPDWQLFASTFVAQGASSSFTITSTSNPGNASGGLVLDAISVVGVPEPSSLVLAAIGFMVAAVWRRRTTRGV
jgi:hypothetical protein